MAVDHKKLQSVKLIEDCCIINLSIYFIMHVDRGRRPFSNITHNNSICENRLHLLVPACS